MLSTLLAEHPWLARAGFALAILVAPLIARWLHTRRRVAATLAVLSSATAAVLTLYPTGRDGAPGCVLNVAPTDLLGIEPQANVLLFVPPVLTLGIAVGRPLLAFLAGVVGSAIIELAQWAVPVLGRSCTTADWLANVLGAALGAGLAVLGGLLARRRLRGAERVGMGA